MDIYIYIYIYLARVHERRLARPASLPPRALRRRQCAAPQWPRAPLSSTLCLRNICYRIYYAITYYNIITYMIDEMIQYHIINIR